ncbi:MAG: glycosyltransferase [Acidobacteriaceae bacterium]|nr:glycosyltransferase [Acidobacteriaceae bacterium]MBV9779415.1 glycosyltransferase [Acidobacteriaceae bacterium]
MDQREALEAAQRAIEELRSELKTARRHVRSLVSLIERHETQLSVQQSSIARLDRILMELLTGRTWRTLRAAGRLIGKLVPFRSGAEQVLVRNGSYLVCDQPEPRDSTPRSGKIRISGWCLAPDGVDSVQVDIPSLPLIETSPNVPRPDVKRSHPELDCTGRSGFSIDFDSLQLPNGRYPITIRLISNGKAVNHTKTSVRIDHERGFASDYERWIQEIEQPGKELIRLKLPSLERRPLISIVMPVYKTNPPDLSAAIQSVIDQTYDNWELCIADDYSSCAEVKSILEDFAAGDRRIKLEFRSERGGISRASNSALEMTTGDYVCFLDHDDTLAPNALAYICEALDRCPEADLLYSDSDKIDERGNRYEPFLKPDWSPDLLLSENYITHLLTLRKDLLQKIGSFDPASDGAQDYDLILKAVERAAKIEHIPRVLYHWRAIEGSTATAIEYKQYALDAAGQALARYCERASDRMKVEPGKFVGRWRIRYAVPPDTRVSIIIAAGGRVDALRTNLSSLLSKTVYPIYEVVVMDNSKHNTIEKVVKDFSGGPHGVRYIDWRNKPFNYSLINNTAARHCDSAVLLFLNDDTSVIEPDWLEAMLELVVRPEVGAVGAKLLYPDRRIQHAGVVMGLYDNCGHAFKGLNGDTQHYFDFPDVIRNVSAVTGACLATKAQTFWEVGGFDETEFAVAFNDIDLCLKIGSRGYRVLYTPHALLYHFEAFSKTPKDLIPHPQEVAAMRSKWGVIIAADPYYNPNLTRNDEDFSLRKKSDSI